MSVDPFPLWWRRRLVTAGAEHVGPRGLEDLLQPAPWRVWLVSECGPEWPRGLADLMRSGHCPSGQEV